jgi:alpha-tubulin suppressor-like RCC1 family protein
VRCWGRNAFGALGYGHTDDLGDEPGELPPGPVDVGAPVLQLAVGGQHICALLAGGTLRCWGRAEYFGLWDSPGLGDEPAEMPPPDVALGVPALQVATGLRHTCAIVVGGTVRCWGTGQYGKLGYGDQLDLPVSNGMDVPGIAGAAQLSLGDDSTCVLLDDGTVRCWGSNDFGQAGLGHTDDIGDEPGEMPPPETKVSDPGDPVVRLGSGLWHRCAVLASGKVRCWGYNTLKQLGSFGGHVGDDPGEMPPADVDLGAPAVDVVAGFHHSCALMQDKQVKCWGTRFSTGYGPDLDINTPGQFPPADVALGGDVVGLSGHAGEFTCALLADASVRCWGDNWYGQMGQGNQTHYYTPAPPVPL